MTHATKHKLTALEREMLEALHTALNMEGPATKACHFMGAFKGIDAKYHFDKIRAVIAKTADAA